MNRFHFIVWIAWLLASFHNPCFGQEYRPDKVSKKAVQLYEKAFEKASQNETKEAITLLQQATEADENYADAWIALGDSTPTFRNTAIKYLWRYGKKNGNNKDDLMKTLHYVLMMIYNDHYRNTK